MPISTPPRYPVLFVNPALPTTWRYARWGDWGAAAAMTTGSFFTGFFIGSARTRRGVTLASTLMGTAAGLLFAFERSYLRLTGYAENQRECRNFDVDYHAHQARFNRDQAAHAEETRRLILEAQARAQAEAK